MIEPTSIPAVVPRKLADLLHCPVASIQSYLARPAQRTTADFQTNERQKVAEKYLWYPAQELPGAQKQRFYAVIEASAGLSAQQKAAWRAVLEREQLM